MEKKYLLFFTLTFLAIFGYAQLTMLLAPPPQDPPAEQDAGDASDPTTEEGPTGDVHADGDAANGNTTEGADATQAESASSLANHSDATDDNETSAIVSHPVEYLSMGSADPQDPFGLLVVASNRGATIEQVELNNPKYRDLGTVENQQQFGHAVSGYLGPLIVTDLEGRSGVKLEVVARGTPAARAHSEKAEAGLRVGDVILAVDGQEVVDRAAFLDVMGGTKPGTSISIVVERDVAGAPLELGYEIALERPRMKIIQTESEQIGVDGGDDAVDDVQPAAASFYMELEQLGAESIKAGNANIAALPSLRDSIWQVTRRPNASNDGEHIIEFTLDLQPGQLESIGETGALRVIRRYRLAPVAERHTEDQEEVTSGYDLKMELEFENLSDAPRELAYRLDGPAGLPTEGWYYLYKVHPQMWHRAGARDVIWRTQHGHALVGCTDISKNAKKNANNPVIQMNETSPAELGYAGVDTQYFSVVVKPDSEADKQSQPLRFSAALAMPVGKIPEKQLNLTNVSFRLISRTTTIPPHEKLTQNFTIFAGPKEPHVLAGYGLDDIIVYGWFKPVAQLMGSILHGSYWLTTFGGAVSGSYALSIVLLTVLVRGCMFPLGRRQAQMAAKMQELAPEMKKIADQYKNDMEKKAKAQQDLFKKHNYNPLSGCLPMVIQLPIFIGLYRALSVDIQLRGASMVPGLPWCENLAAPDRLFYWGDLLPAVFAAPNGFLGPYFNILPLVTIAFFMVHQKLFTPPATDDQTRMQHQMMKFMMIFMGFIFFKVAAGLCIYIISSSAWGVAERLLLPKPKPKSASGTSDSDTASSPRTSSPNGSAKASAAAKKKKKKAKGRR